MVQNHFTVVSNQVCNTAENNDAKPRLLGTAGSNGVI